MIFLDFYQSAHVAEMVCQRDVRLCTHHTHASEGQSLHGLLHGYELIALFLKLSSSLECPVDVLLIPVLLEGVVPPRGNDEVQVN